MAADEPAYPRQAVPEQSRGPVPVANRIVRQVEAIDAWNRDRRLREQWLRAPFASRDERTDAARHLTVLQRTHDAIVDVTARGLASDVAPLLGGLSAVVAHGRGEFAGALVLLLAVRGVTVVASTDNGAAALGAVVVEQPDLLLAGDGLALLPAEHLLAEVRLFAPHTLLVVRTAGEQQTSARLDAVVPREDPPADVADALADLLRTRRAQRAGADVPSARRPAGVVADQRLGDALAVR